VIQSIAVGDLFIGEDIMKKALEEEFDTNASCFFWGSRDKGEMRTKVKNLELGGPTAEQFPEALLDSGAEAEILMIHLCPVPRALIEAMPKLRIIASTRGGVENVDVEAASEHGIAVISNPAHNANAVAELTVGLMLAETRNIARSHSALKEGQWREKYPRSGSIPELRGSTVGLIGFGSIGRLTARKLRCFDVKILIHDPFVNGEDIREAGGKPATIEELLSSADIVSLHARAHPDSKPILGRTEFGLMKKTAYFINTARANIVDMEALRETLSTGAISGAALDVFDKEPIPDDDPLIRLDNVTLTNHRGSDTLNSYEDSPGMVAKEVKKFFGNKKPYLLRNPEQFPGLKP
jgi:D-3-phosphoglycerate dehydrogenase